MSRRALRSGLRRAIARRRSPADDRAPALENLPDADRRIVETALPFTMTGHARLIALVDAVRYCVRRDVEGALAECGVWRGGSVLAMLLTLQELGVEDRDVYLYDTFAGMTEPGEHDVSADDEQALDAWRRARERGEPPFGELFDPRLTDIDAVRTTVLSSGYPADRVHLIQGPVERTLPERAPERLALMRLDTDWYESTRHELEHLYPRLSAAGVVIIDDYGHWRGARRAVDEYFAATPPAPLLHRIDYSARIAVKA